MDPNQVPDLCHVKSFKDFEPIEIRNKSYSELNFLSQVDLPIAAMINELCKNLECIINENTKIDQQNLGSCLDLFMVFFLGLGKITRNEIDDNKLRTQLLNHGFSTLADRYQGKFYHDSDVQNIMASIFKKVQKNFDRGNLNAN